MSNANTLIRCACCQAEITAPQFHNGKPYGWTCIHKVAPGKKRTKDVYHAVDFKQQVVSPSARQVAIVKWNGQRKAVVFYCQSAGMPVTECDTGSTVFQDGVLYVSELKLKNSGFSVEVQPEPGRKEQAMGDMGAAIKASLGL